MAPTKTFATFSRTNVDPANATMLDARSTLLDHDIAESFDKFAETLTTEGAGQLWLFRHREHGQMAKRDTSVILTALRTALRRKGDGVKIQEGPDLRTPPPVTVSEPVRARMEQQELTGHVTCSVAQSCSAY